MITLRQHVESLVAKTHADSGVPGIAVTVSHPQGCFDVTAGTSSLGTGINLTSKSGFQIGCITKLLTCLVAMDLICTGRIGLDAPVREYLPHFGKARGSGDKELTVRHLGSHTGGYQGLNPGTPQFGHFYSWSKFQDFLRERRQVFVPGEVFSYEHTGPVLLGEIVERVTGMDSNELVRKKIMLPLGIDPGPNGEAESLVADHSFDEASHAYKKVRSVPFCAFWKASLSNWTAGSSDLAKIAELLGGANTACEIDSRAITLMRSKYVAVPSVVGGSLGETNPVSFGFGCAQYQGGLFGHNGSSRGQTCGIRFDSRQQLAIAVALNSWQPHIRDRLLASIVQFGKPECHGGPALSAAELYAADVEGGYIGCTSGIQVRVSRSGADVNVDLLDVSGATQLRIQLGPNSSGAVTMKNDAKHLCVGFFREAVSTPCLMLGMTAFRKYSN